MPPRVLTSGRAAVDRDPCHVPRAQPLTGQASLSNEANWAEHSSHLGRCWRWEVAEGYQATMETQWVPGVSSGMIHVSANTCDSDPSIKDNNLSPW